MSASDINAVRLQFPALDQPQVFFDNAGGSQTLGAVIESVSSYLSKTNVQLGATYAVGQKSNTLYSAGYEAAAKYINALPEEIVLGPSTTQLFRNLSYGLSFPPGYEVIISKLDHEANIASWVSLAAIHSLVIKWWAPPSSTNPKLLVSDLKKLLTDKTVLVSCTHASNILGTIHDIKSIAEAVHEVKGALLVVDAVAYAPHRRIDVKGLGVDFYAFSWYKVYGPHISMLYASPSALSQVKSLGHFFNPSETLENKLGLAGSNYELTSSIPAVLSYFSAPSAWESVESHERELQSKLLEYLSAKPKITIYGEPDPDTTKRVSTISFTIEGSKSKEVVEEVDRATEGKMGIRWGSFYSNRLVAEVLGLDPKDGVIRASMVHYNTVDEVNQLIEVLEEVQRKAG